MAKRSSTTKIGNTKVVGATDADKQAIAAAKASVRAEERTGMKAAASSDTPRKTRQQTARGDQAPEAAKTTKEASAKAKKLFDNADDAARVGLPPDMTVEQHANHVRRAALGY